eukprot:COSAG03_NODE_15920_length_416_cov_4.009464_2_plen_59_part_00
MILLGADITVESALELLRILLEFTVVLKSELPSTVHGAVTLQCTATRATVPQLPPRKF